MPQLSSKQNSDDESGGSVDEESEVDDGPSAREFETWPERGRIVVHTKENNVDNTMIITKDD